jgi:ArsR family transcriptional regulator
MNTEHSFADIALALSDPLRLRILDLLYAGRNERCHSPGNPDLPQALCALDLQRQIGDIAPSKLAYHLKELREVGLIHERKNGKYVYYQLNQACIKQFLQDTNQRYLVSQESGVIT